MTGGTVKKKRATYAGMGMLGIVLGAVAMYIIYERGWR
tara:strand:+ start:282 stop:395 length:114 start_codon:yes stop_codon:yes gene_type:complete